MPQSSPPPHPFLSHRPIGSDHPQLILEAVDRPRNIQYKGAAGSTSDLVTDTDRASEEAILGVLQRAFPGHAILGEEGGVYGAWGVVRAGCERGRGFASHCELACAVWLLQKMCIGLRPNTGSCYF